MVRLALRQLAGRRTSTALAALGLLVATLGFVTLVSTSQTTRAVLGGDIARSWQTPYDLLVRPPGSVTALEAGQGLVRPNYVSGLAGGGVTLDQLAAIRRVPGVRVAAPVAVVGAVNWQTEGFGVELGREPPGRPLAVYRLAVTSTTDAGLSTYPVETHYVVVASRGEVRYLPYSRDAILTVDGRRVGCSYPVTCFAPRVCDSGRCGPPQDPPGYGVELLQPIVIAGVDPAAEAALAGLDRCVTTGRYLQAGDRVAPAADRDPPGTRIPVLVSARSFVDETLAGRLARATDPGAVLRGRPPARLAGWRPLRESRITVAQLYRAFLPRVGDEVDEWPVWSVGDVTYREEPGGRLVAADRRPDLSIYQRENFHLVGEQERLAMPPAARDRWFRPVVQHGYEGLAGNRYWEKVGTYDPDCLPGFDPLAGAGLETYSTPAVRLDDGRRLGPSRSLGAYVTSPPLVLTTLDGAAWLSDPARFQGRPGRAFVSVVRVRLDGVAQPGRVAERRLAQVATDIRDATGLEVDVVKGTSPKEVRVDLPAGRFGRPALALREPWSVKGVALRFTRAVSAQNLALFALALVGATILVGETAYISVRRRRAEFAVLRALGWPTRRIAALVELETVALGLGVGLVAVAVGVPLTTWLGVRAIAWVAVATAPLAMTVAALAALVPALAAARGTTARVLAGRGRVRRSRPPRSSATLGLRELAGPWRTEALLGATAVALGAAMLGGVVLVAAAFRGRLDATVLGVYLAGRVRPFHLAVAALTLTLGVLAAGQVVTLGYLERQASLAALRALGWPRSRVLVLLAAQGLALGLAGGGAGALAVWAAGALAGATPSATGLAAGVGLLVAVAASGLAAAGPLWQAYRSDPAEALRGE